MMRVEGCLDHYQAQSHHYCSPLAQAHKKKETTRQKGGQRMKARLIETKSLNPGSQKKQQAVDLKSRTNWMKWKIAIQPEAHQCHSTRHQGQTHWIPSRDELRDDWRLTSPHLGISKCTLRPAVRDGKLGNHKNKSDTKKSKESNLLDSRHCWNSTEGKAGRECHQAPAEHLPASSLRLAELQSQHAHWSWTEAAADHVEGEVRVRLTGSLKLQQLGRGWTWAEAQQIESVDDCCCVPSWIFHHEFRLKTD